MTNVNRTSNPAEVKPWGLFRMAIVLVVALVSTAFIWTAMLAVVLSAGTLLSFSSIPKDPPLLKMAAVGAVWHGLLALALGLAIRFDIRSLLAAIVGAIFAGLATWLNLTLEYGYKEWGIVAWITSEILTVSGIAATILIITGRIRRPIEFLPTASISFLVALLGMTLGPTLVAEDPQWWIVMTWCAGAWIWMSAVYWTEVAARRATWVGGIIWLALMPVPLIVGRLWFHL
jgi:hypothetical protein